jgi:hypothetical protein
MQKNLVEQIKYQKSMFMNEPKKMNLCRYPQISIKASKAKEH